MQTLGHFFEPLYTKDYLALKYQDFGPWEKGEISKPRSNVIYTSNQFGVGHHGHLLDNLDDAVPILQSSFIQHQSMIFIFYHHNCFMQYQQSKVERKSHAGRLILF